MNTSPTVRRSNRLVEPYHRTRTVTFGGHARSGKGTSAENLASRLDSCGLVVRQIDQGLKFRALGKLGLRKGIELNDAGALDTFLRSEKTQQEMLVVLGDVSSMDKREKEKYLYTPVISEASGKVGKIPVAHRIATDLLRAEVQVAVADKTDVIIIDGRTMDKYGRQYDKEGLADFTLGWYFRCDSTVAARRSLKMFGDPDDMTSDERGMLLKEAIRISDRNRSDSQRDESADPMREPANACQLHLADYRTPRADVPYKMAHDALRRGVVSLETSFTRSIEEMTGPVTELSMLALKFTGAPLTHEAVGIRVAHDLSEV